MSSEDSDFSSDDSIKDQTYEVSNGEFTSCSYFEESVSVQKHWHNMFL